MSDPDCLYKICLNCITYSWLLDSDRGLFDDKFCSKLFSCEYLSRNWNNTFDINRGDHCQGHYIDYDRLIRALTNIFVKYKDFGE
jgi:hypothetical protein